MRDSQRKMILAVMLFYFITLCHCFKSMTMRILEIISMMTKMKGKWLEVISMDLLPVTMMMVLYRLCKVLDPLPLDHDLITLLMTLRGV